MPETLASPPDARPGVAAPSAGPDAGRRRGPLRPERLAPVRARLHAETLRQGLQAADALALAAGAATAIAASSPSGPWTQPLGAALPVLAQAVAARAALSLSGAYARAAATTAGARALSVTGAAAAAWLTALGLARTLPGGDVGEAAAGALATTLALALVHGLWTLRVRAWRRRGRLTPNVVVVGATADAARLIARALETRAAHVLGVFDDRGARAPADVLGVPVLGSPAALPDHRLLPYVDRVVIAVSAASQARTRELAERLRGLPNLVTTFADLSGDRGRDAALARMAEGAGRDDGAAAQARRALAKRALDVALSLLALAILWPVLLLTALAVRLDSRGPVLFRQVRHGFSNEPITVFKFRSLLADAADPLATLQVRPDDARVTRVGRFIRQASLDELPQLWNVLKGEMSLVGPRPHAVGMKTAGADARSFVAEYAWRHRVKPGLTGWAQVNGSRGPVHTPEDVRRRVALDLEYIERQSLAFDLWILLLTVPRLLGDGAAAR